MASSSKRSLLHVSEKEIALIRSTVKLGGEDSIKRDVDMVVEWYRKQHHLPRVPLDRDIVEQMLISRKGSVEQTKQRIDLLCTLKTLMPEIASPRDIFHPDIQLTFRAMKFAAMPRLNHDLTRVHVHQMTKDSEFYNLADTFKYIFMMMDYRLKYDYFLGDRYIYDLKNSTLGHLTKLNPIAFKKSEVLLKGYGNRIFSFHFINAPSFIGTIVDLTKNALSPKMGARIVVHQSLEELHRVVDKSILPKDYGGDEATLEELAEQWKEEFGKEDIRQYLLQQERLTSDEALRVAPRPSDEMLGIPGSFKRLEVD